jgi:PAS domain S-box-containing protein
MLLLAAGGLAVRQYIRFSAAANRVEHTYRVLQAIDDLQTRVVDGETALRGYLLTHDTAFLGPYEAVGAQAAALADQLVTLVADDATQRERAAELRTVVAVRVAEMANVHAADAAGGLDGGAARLAEGRGREQMDRARAIAAEMRTVETSLLAERARQAELARRAGLGFGVVSIIVAAALGLVGLSVNSTFERRRLAFESELAARLAAERSAAWASEELLESETLNRSILDSSGDCIALLEPDGRIVSMNGPGLKMLAIDDFGALKDRPWSALWGANSARAGQAVADALTNGEGRFQGTTRGPQGLRWWDVIITPVRDGSGDVMKLLCTSRDVTERKRSEDAVRESEQRFRTLSDTLPQFVWSTRADGYHDYFNERWYEYTGMPRPEEPGGERDPAAGGQGWNWKNYLHPADFDVVLKAWADSLESGKPYGVEYRVKRHDGAYRWFVVRALPFRDESGTITRWFGTATDIDDQKRADEERTLLLASERAARSEAERAARMKDEFVSTLSHELRTPLNAIVGWTGVLKHDQSPETLAKGLEVIDRNLRRQSQMIDDLLDVSRIISGKMRLDVQRVELASVIEEAVASAQPAADAKGVRLITVLGSAAAIQGDPGRLQQVVWNLVANGIKFTPKGGTVKVTLRRSDSLVHIQVSDSGQGIAPEFLQHVFQRFRQSDASLTRTHGGLGLGLAIVKNLVEMHGGSVEAASDGEGLGSTFTVRLPLAAARADEPTHDGLADTLRLDPSRFGRLLEGVVVLVVDDEPDSRDLMQRLLEDAGARVSIAASAQEACAQLEQGFLPDIIISDIGMPELDGYDFMRRVRWMDGPVASVPAAAITALARVEDRKRALMAGYQTHLSKPVDPAELVATVASFTKRTGRLS